VEESRHADAWNGTRRWWPAAVRLAGIAALIIGAMPGDARTQDLEAGKRVYERANCVGCHKWHGGGGGGYGGAALSLRETALDRELLIEVVRCGRPATRMPYHDRGAYQQTECYGGMSKADLGADFPPKAASFLRDAEIEAVADYVLSSLQGKAEPTLADCVAFWGEDSRECASMR
jgi:mono/diheme cytochrome c family protein